MGKVAFMFPGQGSQYVGMGKELYENIEAARRLMDKAEELTGYPLKELCFEGPMEKLTDTRYTQPALYVVESMALELLKTKGMKSDLVFGHSLGEFTALYAAGIVTFEEGLKLVKRRGELMAGAGEKNPGTMAAIIGLPRDTLEKLVSEFENVVLANINSPQQIVISGKKEEVEKAAEKAKGLGAKKAVILKVSAAFHSPLMEEAAREFEEVLDEVEFKKPEVPIIPNALGKVTDDIAAIKEAVRKQLLSPVLFVDTLNSAWDYGVTDFIEVGPGRVLSGLLRRTIREAKSYQVEKPGDEKKLFEIFQGR